jgi:outer membrane protein insertion porin family
MLLLILMLSAPQADQPKQPPADSPTLVRAVEVAFPAQGNVALVEPETYRYYIHTKPSRPSADEWIPYDPQTTLADFRRLWATGFLDDLSIDVTDEPYENGVVGKRIVFNLGERSRVKLVDYRGSKAIEDAKIEERLKSRDAQILPDSFLDAGRVRKVEGILREMLLEKGFQFAHVTHQIADTSSPRLLHLTFTLDEGPNVRIRRVTFVGASAMSERALQRQLKDNKQRPWWLPSFLPGGPSYQEAAFDEDADRITQYYRDNGYITATVGAPEVKPIEDSSDGKIRWVELRIPITEGPRYKVGEVTFDGNNLVPTAELRPHFGLDANAYYSERDIRKGLQNARERYGAEGYFEFTGYPELTPRAKDSSATVDVIVRFQEGRQYFVNRIALTGNTFTHDAVVRRELRLHEGGVFNTEALKDSIKRLNQLGYFKPIAERNIKVDKTPGRADQVDVALNVDEQNRDQINFGAGVSQIEGLFGNVSYTTANVLGRGESLRLSVERGSLASLYQASLTEPYLFNRPITGSISLFAGDNAYATTSTTATDYSEARKGMTFSLGRSLTPFARVSLGYTYEIVDATIGADLMAGGTSVTAGTPLFSAADTGRHVDGRLAPSFVYNTIDNPFMPHSGVRLTGSVQLASHAFGGSYDYFKPDLEAVWYRPTSRRTGFGFRAQGGLLQTYGSTTTVPYYLRYFLGGENQIRGYDIRTVGPLDTNNRALGGNSFVLFNAEYHVDLADSVRLLAFQDAGQAFDGTHPFTLGDLRTSTGVELRIIVPVLHVPLRFIYYWNLARDSFQPAQGFKFAVGVPF